MTLDNPVGVLQTDVAATRDHEGAALSNHSSGRHYSAHHTPDQLRTDRLHSMMEDAFQNIKSPTSTAKQAEQAMKRRTAADWIHSITGESVPVGTDHEFRAKLRDGILLCKILNCVKPGTISRIIDVNELETNAGEVIQTMENVTNFLKGAQAVGIPEDYIFKLGDLEDSGPADRPRVVACLLCLKRMSEGKQLTGEYSTPARSPYGSALPPRRYPYRMMSPGSEASGENGYDESTTPPMRSAAGKGVAAAVGVTRLMKQCTQMLQDKMWTDNRSQTPTPPRGMGSHESALEIMGPVLESVLGSLTKEYENRLLAKDHEMNSMRDSLQAEQARRRALEAELSLATNAAALAAAQVSSTTSASADHVSREALDKAQEDLASAQAESSRLRGELSLFEEKSNAARQELEEELVAAQDRLDALAELEESYKRVCDENRQLYNTVQDLKGAIRVYCRVRPRGKTGDSSSGCLDLCDNEIACYNDKGLRKIYQFDKVFGEDSNQTTIYDETSPLVRCVLDGFNVCIFAYGQTGSGKTHTMSGTDVHKLEGRGINYRALDDLFAIAQRRSDEWKYVINCQMLEIYNETLRDLLVDSSVPKKDNRLDIRMTERSGNNVPDATQVMVSSTEDVLEIMARGARNRAVGETKMNDRSSRSHQVLTVMVDGKNSVTGVHTHACLNLIDLAGSERVQRSEATGDRLKEAQHINKSLSALGDVMSALANGSSHIPYRNSKLTQLLQDSLGGQAKTMMFMHIAPEISSYGETISTLMFGTRVSQVSLGAAKQNREGAELFAAREAIARLEAGNQGADAELERLRAEVAQLRAESGESHARAKNAEAEANALRSEIAKLQDRLANLPRQDMGLVDKVEQPSLSLDLNGLHRHSGFNSGYSSKAAAAAVKAPLREAQMHQAAGVDRSVTSQMQNLRSKENTRISSLTKLKRPNSARAVSSDVPAPQSRGSLTHRGDRPASANDPGRKLSIPGPPSTPTDGDGTPASRVPRFSRTPTSSGPPSSSRPAARTGNNLRQSAGGRWV